MCSWFTVANLLGIEHDIYDIAIEVLDDFTDYGDVPIDFRIAYINLKYARV